ncbi:OsmC family protein [Glaciecola petra]|uniref:OsmC family protein n=1 Tax=Glaciecola petra TaxID=3075602 RepID=A0ABU2ZS23_9ALTE|nr:OsmC family protein [Aestuariibacter sp. P117]MDT0594394.1 OsmC family protein [Aestuariibacter sp. P117]
MKAEVVWQKSETGLAFEGTMDDGRTLHLDGNGEGLSPMQSVLMSLGACSSVDVVEIMRKARQPIEACVCKLEAKRAESAPRIFTHIHAEFVVKGDGIKEKHLARAVQLSCEKYCSVMLMLVGKVQVSSSYVIES